jgi:hypothetical protein
VVIFKEGKQKTLEYALLKSIPIVSPLWLHECRESKQLVPKDNYLIKKTYTEILNEKVLSSNTSSIASSIGNKVGVKRKRKSGDDETTEDTKKQKVKKSEEEKKYIDLNDYTQEIEKNKKITENVKNNSKSITTKSNILEENKDILTNKENKKITNFFGKTETKKTADEIVSNIIEDYCDKLHICSYNLDDNNKNLIRKVIRNLGIYALNKIPITTIDKLKEHSYIVTSQNYRKNDLKVIYAILNNIKLLNLSYFEQADKIGSYPSNTEDYIIKPDVDTTHKPFQKERLKIFLHESLGTSIGLLLELVKLLGGEQDISEHLRLSDICIINKYEVDSIPSNVKVLNQDFLIDCLFKKKLMDVENLKYHPEKVFKKK